jgi:hypothetical protein
MGGGSGVVCDELSFPAVARRSCRRLSSFGRNLIGVCRTDGADEGGLKMMWSCCGEFFESRKDASGLTFRRCFVRRYEDSCRRAVLLNESRH